MPRTLEEIDALIKETEADLRRQGIDPATVTIQQPGRTTVSDFPALSKTSRQVSEFIQQRESPPTIGPIPQPGETIPPTPALSQFPGTLPREDFTPRTPTLGDVVGEKLGTGPLDIPKVDRGLATEVAFQAGGAFLATIPQARAVRLGLKAPSIISFALKSGAGSAIGEAALQSLEAATGKRKNFDLKDMVKVGLAETAFAGALPLFGKVRVARAGSLPPGEFIRAALDNPLRSIKLVFSEFPRSFMQGRSFEFLLGREIQGTALSLKQVFTPMGIENARSLVKATRGGIKIDVEPLIRVLRRLASGPHRVRLRAGATRASANQLRSIANGLETRFAEEGFGASPLEYNAIIDQLDSLGLQRRFQKETFDPSRSVIAAENIKADELLPVRTLASKTLKRTMNKATGGRYTLNQQEIKQTLDAAEKLIKEMPDKSVAEFVANVHNSDPLSETTLQLLIEFDDIAGTNFAEQTLELARNRLLTVDPSKPITGFSRSIAPRLVIMRQIATKLLIPGTRVASTFGGPLLGLGERRGEELVEGGKKVLRKGIGVTGKFISESLARELQGPTK